LSPDEQQLTFYGNILRDYNSFAFSGIQKDSFLDLELIYKKVFIQIKADKPSISIMSSNSDSIQTVKLKILDKEGIPITKQRLFFNGELLEDNKYVCMYKFFDNSIVHLEILE